MRIDWIDVAIGVLFIGWAWWAPRQMRGIRDRIAAKGGDVARFEQFRNGVLMRVAPVLAVVTGVLLILTGVLLGP